ncbi:hypothetical protein GLOIN_2v1512290 [Rhizophagus irregularis DAOM 181602=DAOM 197198]|nr:hypothetical protein GLOIN_2v1512290 [Rhizophagus irregularis DAOM 181602=DAOM 197198]
MSYNRRACISHHKNLDIFQNIKKPLPLSTNNVNNKWLHATLTYKQWHQNVRKHVYSNRLGISYDVSYLANGRNVLRTNKNFRMYRKRFDNFLSHHSDSSKRSKRQKSRFQRACRSVFHDRGNNDKFNRYADTLKEKLHRAKHQCFLFLPSQYIKKSVHHLKYYKRPSPRDEKHYNFPIPVGLTEPLDAKAVLAEDLEPPPRPYPGNDSISTSNSHLSATTSQPILLKEENTWHDKLGIWIPNDLFPYVTEEPVYISNRQAKIKGQQYEPGCIYWLNGIRKRKEAHELAVRLQKEREAWDVNRLAHEEELANRAKLWCTSSNRVEYRENMCKDLTEFQDHFHKKITKLTERRSVLHNRLTQKKNVYKTNKQLLQLEQELGLFNIEYFSVMDDRESHYRYKGHTSDDAKQLELRPHKRLPIPNTDRHITEVKKLRLDILSPEDSKVFVFP